MHNNNLAGQILVAIPNTAHEYYHRGLLLVTNHGRNFSNCIQFNKPILNGINVSTIMMHSGLDYSGQEPIYWGGPDETSKVQFIHSLDWAVGSTRMISENIGLTTEVSILAAISRDMGPMHWRCVLGCKNNKPGFLEGEMSGEYPWTKQHRWLTLPALSEYVFEKFGDDQWLSAIEAAGKLKIKAWF